MYLGDEVLTARQVRDQISCYAQAFADRGLGRGSAVAMLSAKARGPLHHGGQHGERLPDVGAAPLGSLDDHAYVLEDAGVETLVFDPTTYGERAAALQDRVPA